MKPERKRRVALLLGGLTAAFLLGELALRLAGLGYPPFSAPDPVRGWALRPHTSGRYDREGDALIRINGAGMRDRERSERKPSGVFRIAVLGDSFVEAREVPYEASFCALLETELLRPNGEAVEVLNFGVRGYGTAQQLLTLRETVARFSPDLVILAFFTGNDPADNARALDASSTSFARPYFALVGERLVLDDSFRRSWPFLSSRVVSSLVVVSRTAQLGVRAYHGLVRRAGRRERPIGVDYGLYPWVYARSQSQEQLRAWDVTERLLEAIRDESRRQGAELAVISVGSGAAVDPDPHERQKLAAAMGVDDWLLPDDRIAAAGQRLGFATLSLTRVFQAEAEADGRPLHGFANTKPGRGHWNERGHRVAAERTAEWLDDVVLLPPLPTR